MRTTAFLALLLASSTAIAQQPLIPAAGDGNVFEPPAELTSKDGLAFYVPPTGVVDVVYVALDGEEPISAAPFGGSKSTFIFITAGKPAGKAYRFVGVASDAAGKLTRKAFVVPIPGPPPPNPKPPTPPAPNPLRDKFKAAFDADPGDSAAKNATRLLLVELYRQAVGVAKDPAVTTTTALREKLRTAARTLAADQLVGLRTAIAEQVGAVLVADAALTDASRAAAAALFAQVAEALEW